MAVTLLNVRDKADFPQLRAAFLAGYRGIRPLAAGHEQYLDIFMDLRDLQMMIWAIEMRNHPAFRARWEREVREMLSYIRQVVERPGA
jgi:Ser/Thr protein kinase RdoA (MazF antagonist)